MNGQDHLFDAPLRSDGTWGGVAELTAALLDKQGGSGMTLLDEIGDAIYHQGDIYAVKALYALPFLLKFLATAQSDEQIVVLGLIALLIKGSQKAITSSAKASTELKPMYSLLCEATHTYMAHLTSSVSEVRALAAFILGYCANTTVNLVACLKAHYETERDERVQFALVKALTILHGYNEEDVTKLFAATMSEFVLHAIALAMAVVYGDRIPLAAEEILVESLLDEERLDVAYSVAPYPEFSTYATFDALTYLSQRKRVSVLIRGVERWHFTGRRAVLQLLTIIEQLFRFAGFPNEVREERFRWLDETICEIRYGVTHLDHDQQMTFQEMSQEQYQALLCLLNCEYFWYQHTNLLEAYSLPTTQQALRDMIHIK
jgi:hypothetical protein